MLKPILDVGLGSVYASTRDTIWHKILSLAIAKINDNGIFLWIQFTVNTTITNNYNYRQKHFPVLIKEIIDTTLAKIIKTNLQYFGNEAFIDNSAAIWFSNACQLVNQEVSRHGFPTAAFPIYYTTLWKYVRAGNIKTTG